MSGSVGGIDGGDGGLGTSGVDQGDTAGPDAGAFAGALADAGAATAVAPSPGAGSGSTAPTGAPASGAPSPDQSVPPSPDQSSAPSPGQPGTPSSGGPAASGVAPSSNGAGGVQVNLGPLGPPDDSDPNSPPDPEAPTYDAPPVHDQSITFGITAFAPGTRGSGLPPGSGSASGPGSGAAPVQDGAADPGPADAWDGSLQQLIDRINQAAPPDVATQGPTLGPGGATVGRNADPAGGTDPNADSPAARSFIRAAYDSLRSGVASLFQALNPVGTAQAATYEGPIQQTGNPRIDAASQSLLDILAQVGEQQGAGKGPLFGTMVHTEFANQVRSANIPGIGPRDVEQSFSAGGPANYGSSGSIRTDVLVRGDDGKVIAIYDVKTGSAVLTSKRVAELRDEAGVNDSVPVFELRYDRMNLPSP